MEKSILQKYPKTATALLSSIIIAIFLAIFAAILNFDFLQDYKNGEKYSILDKIIYKITCSDQRNIRLRELRPNHESKKFPNKNTENLEYKEYVLRSNFDGFVEPAFVNENPDAQIFFLGGSTTECEYVDEELRFPYLVGKILQQKTGLKINSDNAARSGNNSLHSIDILVNKLLPYQPNIVVMMHNVNDLSALFYEGSYWNKNKTITPISCASKDRDSQGKLSSQWADSSWQNKLIADKNEQEKLLKLFKENLKILIAINKAKNITSVLMTQANRIEKDPKFTLERGLEVDKTYRELYIRFNQIIRQTAREENILLIDLAQKIPSEKKYIYDSVHLNNAGSVLVADEIVKVLYPYIKNRHAK